MRPFAIRNTLDWELAEGDFEPHMGSVSAPGIFFTGDLLGGALRGRTYRSAAIWAFAHTRDPYFEILGASLLPLA